MRMRTLPAPAPWSPPVGSGPVQAGQSRVAKGAPQQQQQHPHSSSIPTPASSSPQQHHHPLSSSVPAPSPVPSPWIHLLGSSHAPPNLWNWIFHIPTLPAPLTRVAQTLQCPFPAHLGLCKILGVSAGHAVQEEGMDEEERSESSKLRGPAPWRGAPRHAPVPWLRTRSQRVQSIHSHPSRGCSETELRICFL